MKRIQFINGGGPQGPQGPSSYPPGAKGVQGPPNRGAQGPSIFGGGHTGGYGALGSMTSEGTSQFPMQMVGDLSSYPTPMPESSANIPPEAREMLKQFGIPEAVINQGDDAIREYAETNGINLPPKQEPTSDAETLNDVESDDASDLVPPEPDEPEDVQEAQSETSSTPIPQDAREQLRQLGVPEEVIEQGDDAIKKFAEDNNISLPERSQ